MESWDRATNSADGALGRVVAGNSSELRNFLARPASYPRRFVDTGDSPTRIDDVTFPVATKRSDTPH